MWLGVDVVPIHGPNGKLIGTQSAIRDITARKQMEEDLRRKTSELAEAQRLSLVGSWTWNPQTDVITWSEEMIVLAGYIQFFDDDNFRRLDGAVQNTLRTGTPYEVETEGRYPDGRKAWFTNRGEVVRDELGQITHLRGTVQDITQRKLAERALRQSEMRYRNLVESSHDWIWEVDSEARYTYAGPQCFQILGYRPEEILGKTPFDLMPEPEASRVAEAFKAIAKERKPFHNLENVNRHKNGRRVVLETNGVPIFNEYEEFVGYRGMDRDITERKHAEEALVQSEQKFLTLFRAAPTAMALNTLDGRFVDVNDAFETATGYTRQETVGQTAKELQLWADSTQREYIRSRLLAEEQLRDVEHKFRKKSGEIRVGLLSSDLIDIGGTAHVLTALKDVTEQKIAEDNLRNLTQRLINAQEDERKRIARELHDNINQRLALISMGIQKIDNTELAADTRDEVHKLMEETKSVSSDIQALSHHLHSASLDLLGLAAGIESFRREFARSHQVTVKFSHSGVPKTIPGEVSLALFRITQEALNNAVKYSGAKDFEVALLGTASHLELRVRDPGMGFDVEAATPRGLGLISMRERVLPLNGTISIASKPMKGTEISVRIPLSRNEDKHPCESRMEE
ncbi:MAG: PAS domain S-box protein [Terriglobia bacterium]|nr:PAS domain S-box protein [Terriglobia bacterium]